MVMLYIVGKLFMSTLRIYKNFAEKSKILAKNSHFSQF